jgi:Ca2+-binding EF-hand superfamily protein
MYDFAESQQKMSLQSRSETTDLIFQYFDLNGDGYLSYSEWQYLCSTADANMSSSDV